MNNIVITKVKEEDLLKCATISVKSWQETYKDIVDNAYLSSLNINDRLKRFKKNYQESPFIAAKINNEVVGFCRYTTNPKIEEFPDVDCELTVLYVEPELKRKGIGSTLFKYTVRELQKLNKKNMIIKCLKGNKIGENFYKKMHGQLIGQSNMQIGNQEYTELIFKFNIENLNK